MQTLLKWKKKNKNSPSIYFSAFFLFFFVFFLFVSLIQCNLLPLSIFLDPGNGLIEFPTVYNLKSVELIDCLKGDDCGRTRRSGARRKGEKFCRLLLSINEFKFCIKWLSNAIRRRHRSFYKRTPLTDAGKLNRELEYSKHKFKSIIGGRGGRGGVNGIKVQN